MCGFVGSIGPPIDLGVFHRARDTLAHRGPDSAGYFETHAGNLRLQLGFNRLRVLDLSPAADQPMTRHQVTLVYNGEIYNFRDLRHQLQRLGVTFQTSSDTEVVLEAYLQWGPSFVDKIQGMFALGLWDATRNVLLLCRDRLGIKPLYYSVSGGRFLFASEPQALLMLGADRSIDESSLHRFLAFMWVPDPDTLFRSVKKLAPGHTLEASVRHTLDVGPQQEYWDAKFAPQATSPHEGASDLRNRIGTVVQRQSYSDVPLGIFLSGGLDSSVLLALAAQRSAFPIRAFAVGFKPSAQALEPGVSDLPYARLVANRIDNVEYHELILDEPNESTIARLMRSFADPVADPAAISSLMISEAAKQSATVILSGVGAEELFAGYPRHRAIHRLAPLARAPSASRAHLRHPAKLLPGLGSGRLLSGSRHLKRLLNGLAQENPILAYSAHHTPASLSQLVGKPVSHDELFALHNIHLQNTADFSPLSTALYLDLKTYLPCLNLAYTDRASMAASVEVRVPFLDELIVTKALTLPDSLKIGHKNGKSVLRLAAHDVVPRQILNRPKSGFGAPVRSWLTNHSSELIEDCLSPKSLSARGFVVPREVASLRALLEHRSEDTALPLWAIVIAELWARTFIDGTAA